jgi:hypothetical protein
MVALRIFCNTVFSGWKLFNREAVWVFQYIRRETDREESLLFIKCTIETPFSATPAIHLLLTPPSLISAPDPSFEIAFDRNPPMTSAMAQAAKLPTTPESNAPTDQRAEESLCTEQVDNGKENTNSISSVPATEEISKGDKKDDVAMRSLESGEQGDDVDIGNTEEEGRRGKYITGVRFYSMVLSYATLPLSLPQLFLLSRSLGEG